MAATRATHQPRSRHSAEVRALGAERGVLAVAGVDPRLVGQGAEEPLLDVVDQAARSAAASFCVLPTPPGNRLSPVKTCVLPSGARQTSAMLPGVCPRRCTTSSVGAPDGHGVAVLDRARAPGTGRSSASAGCATVTAPVRSDDLGQRAVVVPVPVRGDDGAQVGVADQLAQRLGLGGGVDQQRLAGRGVAQQVGVVGHVADRELGDREPGQLADVGRPAHRDVAGVAARAAIGPPVEKLSAAVATVPAMDASAGRRRPARHRDRRPGPRRAADGGRRRPRPPGAHRGGRRAGRRVPRGPPRGRAGRGGRGRRPRPTGPSCRWPACRSRSRTTWPSPAR